jgi:hypothetical protein
MERGEAQKREKNNIYSPEWYIQFYEHCERVFFFGHFTFFCFKNIFFRFVILVQKVFSTSTKSFFYHYANSVSFFCRFTKKVFVSRPGYTVNGNFLYRHQITVKTKKKERKDTGKESSYYPNVIFFHLINLMLLLMVVGRVKMREGWCGVVAITKAEEGKAGAEES